MGSGAPSCFLIFRRFSLLCSVFRLMPSSSAARVLLPLVCCSVRRISCRSASSTVVPAWRPAAGRARVPAVHERRQVLDLDEPALGHDRRPLDDVAQLADVAGPGVPLEDPHRALVDRGHRPAVARVELADERLNEQRQILLAVAQRRQADREHVEAVEQIFAQPARAAPPRADPRWSPRSRGCPRPARCGRRGGGTCAPAARAAASPAWAASSPRSRRGTACRGWPARSSPAGARSRR